ncbi:MAG TPA: carboxymuconolactone decarboxylase family protein [Fimbriimonadaceae bacterium]|nr:carboxymuconolactone decarboxylase family protein [Fimbriimonadaceae bacterium]
MSKLPKRFTDFVDRYPDIGRAYGDLGRAVSDAGPLDAKTRQLVKVGIAIAAGLEGGTHSHVRKAVDAGATPDEIRHAALQCLTTIGFPAMMKGLSWIDDVLISPGSESATPPFDARS